MKQQEHHLDEVIFDYLEGNLSPKEKEAFEIILGENSDLRNEVNAWKSTFIEEALPETIELERTLFVSSKNNRWSLFLNSILFLMTCVLPSSSDIKNQNTTPMEHVTEITTVPVPKDYTKHAKIVTCVVANQKEKSNNSGSQHETNSIRNVTWLTVIDKPALDQFDTLYQSTITQKLAIHNVTKDRSSKTQKRQWLHKEMRALNRKKRRENEKENQIKFQPGRVPYVVPLDVKNF